MTNDNLWSHDTSTFLQKIFSDHWNYIPIRYTDSRITEGLSENEKRVKRLRKWSGESPNG